MNFTRFLETAMNAPDAIFTPAAGNAPDAARFADLLAQSRQPWYESDPGMRVYRGYVPARPDGAQLTLATPSAKGLQCYRHTYEKNAAPFGPYSEARWFLATRYLRRAGG